MTTTTTKTVAALAAELEALRTSMPKIFNTQAEANAFVNDLHAAWKAAPEGEEKVAAKKRWMASFAIPSRDVIEFWRSRHC